MSEVESMSMIFQNFKASTSTTVQATPNNQSYLEQRTVDTVDYNIAILYIHCCSTSYRRYVKFDKDL